MALIKAIKKDSKNIQIGLDIGNHSVKAVVLSRGLKTKLVAFSVKPIGDNIVQAIKDAHAELGFTKNKVITAISGPAVIVRYIEMPSLSDEELQSAIQFEAEKVIPYNINEVELDAVKIEDLKDNKMRVIIAAAKKEVVDSHVKMVYEAAIEPLILDIDSFALMNAFTSAGIDKESVCCLLNIGSKRSNLNIIKGDTSYLSRDIDIAGMDITKVIAESLSVPLPEAEKIKEERMSRFSELSDEDKKGVEGPVTDILLRLADEVRLSFDFYENHYASAVDKVYISGGTARAAIVEKILKENLGRETLKWDPLSNIEITDNIDAESLKDLHGQLAVAIGLALRKTE